MSARKVVELAETHAHLRQITHPPVTPVTPLDIVHRRLHEYYVRMGRNVGKATLAMHHGLATALYMACEAHDFPYLASLDEQEFFHTLFQSTRFDKYLQEASTLLEDVVANSVSAGGIAGLTGDPPVKMRKRRKKR